MRNDATLLSSDESERFDEATQLTEAVVDESTDNDRLSINALQISWEEESGAMIKFKE